MKKLFTFFILVFLTKFSLHANETQLRLLPDKIYLQDSEVTLKDGTIWVQIANSWIPTQALCSDSRGYYVQAQELPLGFWICNRCGSANHPWDFVCRNCGSSK